MRVILEAPQAQLETPEWVRYGVGVLVREGEVDGRPQGGHHHDDGEAQHNLVARRVC